MRAALSPGARRAEGGYALIVAAIAVLFLAVVSTVMVHAAAGGAMSRRLELEREQASLTAAAGVEWAMLTGGSGTKSFAQGSFTVTRGPGRRVSASGAYGATSRVAAAENTIFYVPGSRWILENSDVTFEIFNKTGATVQLTGMTVTLSTSAFYEEVWLNVFDEPGAPGVDYGRIWSYSVNGNGTRRGSGQAITFGGGARAFGAGRQAFVEIRGFKSGAVGSTSSVDMDPHELAIRFAEAAGPLASTAVPRAEQ